MKESHKNKSNENQDEDIEFIEALRTKVEYPIVKRKVIDNATFGYRKYYRYGILWRNMKTRVKEYKEGLFGSGRDLEIALASVVLLFILSTVAYYYYTKPQSNPENIIANQETPAIKITPHSIDTPIATPSPIQTINPDTAKRPENNNDNITQGNTEENNQQAGTNKDRKPRKPEEPKDLYKEDNNIAINNRKRDKRTNNSVKTNNATSTTEKTLTLSNLVYVAVMDLKIEDQEIDPIDSEIKKELLEAISNSGKWRLSSVKDAEAIFKKQENDRALVLFDKKTTNILWKSVDYMNNYKNNKDYIKTTVKTLSNYQKQ